MKYWLLAGIFLFSFVQANAQAEEEAKPRTVAVKENQANAGLKVSPVLLGLPDFIMNTSTSLRTEPDHRSDVQIRLRPGMRVEVLDPISYHYWTKVRVGERIGWAKKHCMDPESGEFDFGEFLEMNRLDL